METSALINLPKDSSTDQTVVVLSDINAANIADRQHEREIADKDKERLINDKKNERHTIAFIVCGVIVIAVFFAWKYNRDITDQLFIIITTLIGYFLGKQY